MRVENRLGQGFESLAKRILYSYVSTYPDFIPIEDSINRDSQLQMYHFMADTLLNLYENPDTLGITDVSDGYYENWEMNNSKPLLIKSMEKIEYKFADFIEMLIKIGKFGEAYEDRFIIRTVNLKITKSTQAKLELLGIHCDQTKEESTLRIEKYPNAFLAWKYYSTHDDLAATKISRVITFIHGRYRGKKYKAMHFFNLFVDNMDIIKRLEDYLEKSHFEYDNFDLNAKTRFAYVKWIKEYPKNDSASVRIFYDWRKKDQLKLEFRLPQFRIMMNLFDQMDTDLKHLVFPRLKNCDGCGYCTQTDKTGKRLRLALKLTSEDVTLSKCPLYPHLTWNYINETELATMIKLFEFSEGHLSLT